MKAQADKSNRLIGERAKRYFTGPKPAHPIQVKLSVLLHEKDIEGMSLRQIAREIGEAEHPQKIKHHLLAVQKRFEKYL